jgi:hypothetical protein
VKYFFIVLAVISIVAIGPILTIWALNTLFPALAISYTLDTWLSIAILGGLINFNRRAK